MRKWLLALLAVGVLSVGVAWGAGVAAVPGVGLAVTVLGAGEAWFRDPGLWLLQPVNTTTEAAIRDITTFMLLIMQGIFPQGQRQPQVRCEGRLALAECGRLR